jgi:hypothetical protein
MPATEAKIWDSGMNFLIRLLFLPIALMGNCPIIRVKALLGIDPKPRNLRQMRADGYLHWENRHWFAEAEALENGWDRCDCHPWRPAFRGAQDVLRDEGTRAVFSLPASPLRWSWVDPEPTVSDHNIL